MSLSARPPPITTYDKTTNIYLLVTFCTDSWRRPWGGRCTFNTFGHRMTHFSSTFVVVGSSDMTRFGSLEFPALPPIGMGVPPISEPSQAFLFGSLDFVADRLGVLHLREEALAPASIGGAPSVGSRTRDDYNDEAFVLHSEQTLCSNPAVSNIHTVIYSLFTISRRLSGETVLTTPRTPYDRFPYGLASPVDACTRGL